MKANEVPEKIYLTSNENGTHYYTEDIPFERKYVEYIRTDDFIEKVSTWIKEMFSETDSRFDQDYTGMLINNFKEVIKQ